MLTVGDWYKALDSIAPFDTAEAWDNCGLLVGSPQAMAPRALFALDITPAVIEEAKVRECGLIISHHPVIFQPLQRLSADHAAYQLAASGIAAICAHTNLDMAEGGVNDALAARLGLSSLRPLAVIDHENYKKVVVFAPEEAAESVYQAMQVAGAGSLGQYEGCAFFAHGEGRFLPVEGANPAIGSVGALERVGEVRIEMLVHPRKLHPVLNAMRHAHPYEESAFDVLENEAVRQEYVLGRVGDLPEPLPAAEFAAWVKERLNVPGLRFVAGEEPVQTVAVCGGAGGDYLAAAKSCGAQAFVTGEVKHHVFLQAQELGLTLLDAGHHTTESAALPYLMEIMQRQLPTAELLLSQAAGNPVQCI